MKQNLIGLLALLWIPLAQGFAQEKIPTISGEVEISVINGTFECDLTWTDIPRIKDYFIRLNSGMNILHMRSKKPNDFLVNYSKSFADSLSTGESNAYYFKDSTGKGKFLPESIQFKYVGKYPVASDTLENYSRKDWKGNIAFNGMSVRSDGRQSAWYPVFYDIENDIVWEKVKYDIEITCSDCSTLYLNGSKPVKDQTHRFTSDIPQELTIFCGNYDFAALEGTYFLNSGLEKSELETFGALINTYKKYYAQNLNVPFGQAVSFVQTTPTSKKDAWMFVSYPTIMSIGWQNGLKNIVEPQYAKFYQPFIAHELGHYYFGTYKVFNSVLGDLLNESFPEFLSLQITKEFIGKDIFNEQLERKLKQLEGFEAMPFAKIKKESEYGNRQLYVYNFGPLIFLAIEREIGEEMMWQWLHKVLKTQSKYTDYAFLCSTLQATLNDKAKFESIKETYFTSDHALENAIKKLKQNR
ncbi:hypothetical protein LAG90_17755 [Marinilongibacter aquaticus]|uniref:hypothetical protein n=1 Tax=Marinilongibacter aquaticus TaxID=2975157 RepID=UPI0021BD143A|nr:hypothetical protein [Marinilongibacter aquaticus]UBM58648.1 hypothetical protein LAG90_17755 [Marinilongibacter aquaticus]